MCTKIKFLCIIKLYEYVPNTSNKNISKLITCFVLRPCLADKFFVKFVCYKFFKNFNYSTLKKFFKVFKLYISKY